MDLEYENALLKSALLGVRGMAVLESSRSATWGKAVEQIDGVLAEIGMNVEMLDEAERDLYGDAERDARDEQASEDRHNDQHRGAVPRTWSR